MSSTVESFSGPRISTHGRSPILIRRPVKPVSLQFVAGDHDYHSDCGSSSSVVDDGVVQIDSTFRQPTAFDLNLLPPPDDDLQITNLLLFDGPSNRRKRRKKIDRSTLVLSNVGKSANILWHEYPVGKTERQKLLKQKGCVIWITGLSGSGHLDRNANWDSNADFGSDFDHLENRLGQTDS